MSSDKKPCIFCKIVSKESPESVIVFETENIIVFKDIRPASDFHYLSVPKKHVHNVKMLTIEDIPLLLELKEGLDKTFEKDGVDPQDTSFGFHWPPFNSIAHLHMHGIAPVSKMRFLARWIFRPNNIWYCTLDYVIARLQGATANMTS